MEAIKASKVKLGDYLVNLGYVSAIEASPTNICFALRTKPDSPTGLLRGAPAGTLNLDPDDLVLFRDH